MIIDKGKLIALLVEKTGQPKAEVEAQLEQLKERIRNVAKSGGAFEIEGFGRFTGQKGEPRFEPSKQLKTEINQKYAGMKPIELMEPFKETGAGIPVEDKPDEPVPPEAEKPAEEKPTQPVEPPEEPEPTTETDAEEEAPAPEPEQPEEKEQPEPVAAAEPEQTATEQEPGPKEKPRQKKKMTQPKFRTPALPERNNNRGGTVFFAVIIVIGLLAAGWAMYDAGMFTESTAGNESGAAPDTSGITGVSPGVSARDDSVQAENSMEQNAGDTVSSNSNAQAAKTNSVYGLKGTVTKAGRDGFTIVIHSFRLRSTVQEIADSLDQQNYRTLLLDGRVSGQTRWRLGIGQFETIEDAQKALEQLPASVRRNYFITRIE